MVRSRFRRTEEEQCGGNSHSRKIQTTNNDESIFTTVTKCHKKHTLTRSRPRSHSRAAAPPTSLVRARASPACRRQLPRRTATHRTTCTQRHPFKYTTQQVQRHRPIRADHHTHKCVTCHTATCETSQGARRTDNINEANCGDACTLA